MVTSSRSSCARGEESEVICVWVYRERGNLRDLMDSAGSSTLTYAKDKEHSQIVPVPHGNQSSVYYKSTEFYSHLLVMKT